MNINIREYLRINPISVHELTLSENSTDCFLYFPSDSQTGYEVYTQQQMFYSIAKYIFGNLITDSNIEFDCNVSSSGVVSWNVTDENVSLGTPFNPYVTHSTYSKYSSQLDNKISTLKTDIEARISQLKNNAKLDYAGAVEIQTRLEDLYRDFRNSVGQIWCYQEGVSIVKNGADQVGIGNEPARHTHKATLAESTTKSFTTNRGGGELAGKLSIGNQKLLGQAHHGGNTSILDMIANPPALEADGLTFPLYGQNVIDWRSRKKTHNNVPPTTNVLVKYKTAASSGRVAFHDGDHMNGISPRLGEDEQIQLSVEPIYESNVVKDLESYTAVNLSAHDYLLRAILDNNSEVLLKKQSVGHLLEIFSETAAQSLSQEGVSMENILIAKLDGVLVTTAEFINWYNQTVAKLNEILKLLAELKELLVSVKPLTYVGRVVISTTDDTEKKVIEHYGGKCWRRMVNFLRGMESHEQVGAKWGEEYVCLRESNVPLHTHRVVLENSDDSTNWNSNCHWMNVGKAGSQNAVVNVAAQDASSGIAVENTANNYQLSPLEYESRNAITLPHDNMPPYQEVYIWECTAVETESSELYTVQFNSDGVVVETRKYPANASIGYLPVVTGVEGKGLGGWFTAVSGGTKIDTSTKVTADVTYYAHWLDVVESTYNVKFAPNGGNIVAWKDRGTLPTNAILVVPLPTNALLTELPTAERPGYQFRGWYTAETGGTKVNIGQKITGNVTYYAQWNGPIEYNIAWILNGHGVLPNNVPYSYTYDTPNYTPNDISELGYEFLGWNPKSIPTHSTGDKTFRALWRHNTYTITLMKNDETADGTFASFSVEYGARVKDIPTNIERVGYNFGGWFSNNDGTGNELYEGMKYEIQDDSTYYAHWIPRIYRVTLDKRGGSGGTSFVYATYGEDMPPIMVPTYESNTFNGYNEFPTSGTTYYNSDGTSAHIWDKAVNSTIYAQWEPQAKYTATFLANGGHTSDGKTNVTYSIPAGRPLSVYIPTFYYGSNIFSGWNPEVPATMPARDVTFTAQWDYVYVIEFDANGGNGGWKRSYSRDTEITTPTANRIGHTFLGWFTQKEAGTKIGNKITVVNDATYYAHWDVNSYTATFDANGGSSGTIVTQNYGTSLTAPDVTRTGYTFTGWNPEVPATMPDEDTTYVAQWSINQYTATFNANGGTGGTTKTQDYGTPLTAPTVTRTNYIFTGWSPLVPSTMPAKDTAYTAQWDEDEVTVTFMSNGQEVGTQTGFRDVDFPLNAPTVGKIGHTFTGWLDSSSSNVYWNGQTMNLHESITLTAQWMANQYPISYIMNGHGSISDGTWTQYTFTSTSGAKYFPPAPDGEDGYTFIGWDPISIDLNVVGPQTFTASWEISDVELTFIANGGVFSDTYSTADRVETHKYNQPLTAPDVARTGYTFTGWNPEVPPRVPAVDTDYTALWSINRYTVYFDSQGGTPVPPITQNYNTAITAPANPTRNGYTFNKWSPAVPARMPASDTTCVASWIPLKYTVTFDANGGSVGSSPTQTYADRTYGDVIPLPTATRTGHSFGGWWSAKVGGFKLGGTTLSVTETVTYYAHWTPNNCTITFNDNDGSARPAERTLVRPYGSQIGGLPYPTRSPSGKEFTGWWTEPVGGTAVTENTMVYVNATYYAHWVNQQYPVLYLHGDFGDGPEYMDWKEHGLDMTLRDLGDPSYYMREGYTYDGWITTNEDSSVAGWTLPEGEESYDLGGTYSRNEPITLYPKWIPCIYDVTFDPNEGTINGSTSPQIQHLPYKSAITPPIAVRTGYTFMEWSPAIPPTVPLGGGTYTAQWRMDVYTITYNLDGGSVASANPTTYNVTTSTFTLNNPTKTGYTFAGWTGSNGTTPSATVTITKGTTGNLSYTANWNQDPIDITYHSNFP